MNVPQVHLSGQKISGAARKQTVNRVIYAFIRAPVKEPPLCWTIVSTPFKFPGHQLEYFSDVPLLYRILAIYRK